MNILRLVEETGLHPKRTSSTNGGEYHSPCPGCGGRDRFCIWPEQGEGGRYWCRQCECNGDTIQYCRDFFGLSFKEACLKAGVTKDYQPIVYTPSVQAFRPEPSLLPSAEWCTAAESFTMGCQRNLKKNPSAIAELSKRGLVEDTIIGLKLGWNPVDIWDKKSDWGIAGEPQDGRTPKQWLPKGWVIPVYNAEGKVIKLKVRRADWRHDDRFPKYVEISGSQRQFAVFGDKTLSIVLVEAEFDAMLIHQEAGDICSAVALGGAGKKPDREIHQFLKSAKRVLFSLDFDEAGRKAYLFWRKNYQNLAPWLVPYGKSPEEACSNGVNLRQWIKEGL